MAAILLALLLQDPDLAHTKLYVYDASRGMTLRVHDDGRVDLTVEGKGEDARQTFTARDAEAFREAYPEAARTYDLDRWLGTRPADRSGDAAEEALRRWREWQKDWPVPGPRLELDLDKLLERQRGWNEELRRFFGRRGGAMPGARPRFGIQVDAVDPTLAAQLGLAEGEGAIVTEVVPGTLAQRSDVRVHDIFVRIDGKAVTDKWEFRTDVLDALRKPAFEAEVVRGGRRVKLRVETGK